MYIVKNIYGIGVETYFRTEEEAQAERCSREGLGWVVEDEKGHILDRDFEGIPCHWN